MSGYFDKTPEETLEELSTNIELGLKSEEAKLRLEKYGQNVLEGKKDKTLLQMLLAPFKDYLIIILLIASAISIFQGHLLDGTVIMITIIINVIIGMSQERKANNALKALKNLSAPTSKVIRNGELVKTESSMLVVGDIVVLEAGDYVPADIRLLESINMKVDESSLTGESVPVEKKCDEKLSSDTSLGDRVNCVFMGTVVTYGRGKGVVTHTGMKTQMGSIATMLNNSEEDITPLQKRMNKFSKSLGILCIGVCMVIFIMGILRGQDLTSIFMTSVSLAVAAVPEALTIIITIILALGMQEMVKINSIVKKLSAVETLGSTTVICSDKTGTLTQNKMTVTKLFDNMSMFDVSGTGYSPNGEILSSDKTLSNNAKKLLQGAVLCNDATYNLETEQIIGDPTEGALLVVGYKAGYKVDELNNKYPRIDEIPFDSNRKLMSTLHSIDGKYITYTKGAPDEIIKRSKFIYKNGEVIPISDEEKKSVLQVNTELSSQALRVLGVAFFESTDQTNRIISEENLIFIGLLGMIDPPREEAKEAIEVCKNAGITVKMITGDHKITAMAIGNQLGLATSDGAIEGKEIEKMSDDELKQKIKTTNIFARVSPEHKVRLITAVKENGELAAMTGDGVNDAPSLRRADIGIAMGITGTDVSKEASDMILTDDNFATIVKAVEQGRNIYNNINKVIEYLLPCNIGKLLLILTSMLMGLPLPLFAIHLLTINLITDFFPALALGLEKGDSSVMNNKPRDPNKPLLDLHMKIAIAFKSIALSSGALVAFILANDLYGYEVARTVCFATLALGEAISAFSSRNNSKFIFKIKVFSNSLLNKAILFSIAFVSISIFTPLNFLFSNVYLNLNQILIVVCFSFAGLIGGELSKIIKIKNKS